MQMCTPDPESRLGAKVYLKACCVGESETVLRKSARAWLYFFLSPLWP